MTTATTHPPAGVGSGAGEGDGDVVRAAVARAQAAITAVSQVALWARSDSEVRAAIVDAERAASSLQELTARLVAEAIDRELPQTDGATGPVAWLESLLRCPRPRAAALVAHARVIVDLHTAADTQVEYDPAAAPAVASARQAWVHGLISADHAVVIGKALHTARTEINADGHAAPPDRAALDAAEASLVEHAMHLRFREFRIVANRLVEVLAPERADHILGERLLAQEREARRLATLAVTDQRDGTHRISGRVPDLHASMLRAALEAIASPRRNPSTTNAGDSAGDRSDRLPETGRPFDDSDEPLRHDQRLGRALCELLEHLPTTELPQHGVASASIVVTIDESRLRRGLGTATLADGTELSAAEARRLACNAGILPAVLGGGSAVLDLGTTRRLFDHHQRVALSLRDRGCVWPGCDRPPSWCEAHHLDPWGEGGPTDLANGVLLCGHHHRHLHRTDWRLRRAPDGIPELIPPEHVDPGRTPRRHHRYDVVRT